MALKDDSEEDNKLRKEKNSSVCGCSLIEVNEHFEEYYLAGLVDSTTRTFILTFQSRFNDLECHSGERSIFFFYYCYILLTGLFCLVLIYSKINRLFFYFDLPFFVG